MLFHFTEFTTARALAMSFVESPERAALRTRLAGIAHLLDWSMNVMVAVVGVGRVFREETFGGQYQPRWLKIYFMVSGPLPTIGMVGAMITGHRWGRSFAHSPRRRRIHRALAWLGYVSWWFSYLPIFAQPLLNRRAATQPPEAAPTPDENAQH